MYHPTSRVLAVLELLQSHRRMTGAELAHRLEVNIRTLRRYIIILQDIGIPIHTERGRYGGYMLDVGFRLPPMMFTNDEALALAIGLLAVDRLTLIGEGIAIKSARAKLEYVLPHAIKQQVQSLYNSIHLDLNSYPPTTAKHLILIISTAIQQARQIHLYYQASDLQETERIFDPYGIAYLRGLWYVVGWCHLRNDLRSFRLDRIVKIIPKQTDFQRPDQFDALAYLKQSIATLERRFTFEVLLHIDILSAKNEIFEAFGDLEAIPNGTLLRGSTDDIDWVARQLAAFSFDFVIRKPDTLRQALINRARELVTIANNHEA